MKRCVAATIFSLTMLLSVASATPVNAFFGKLATMYGRVVSWGQICDMSETVTGTGPPPPPIRVTCTAPAVYGAPEFLAWPKGAAKYHFQSTCSSVAKPGAVMNVRWEGSWTPSETKTDLPNASELLDITGYEAFIPDRVLGARIFMYWTARCTTDPWLVPGTCTPFGAYVPDDLREAFPDIHRQGFMKSGSILSSSLKRMYLAQYQLANPPDRLKTDLVNTTARVGSPSSTAGRLTDRSKFSTRGVETGENQVAVDSSLDETGPGGGGLSVVLADMQAEMVVATVAITFDRPLHFLSANGEDTMIAAGVYEIEPVLDLQLSLAREGQPAILVPAVATCCTLV